MDLNLGNEQHEYNRVATERWIANLFGSALCQALSHDAERY